MILDAARDHFLRSGIAATTMDDIARSCDLAKGTLYLYFRNKDEIAFALLVEATDRLLGALRNALEPRAPAVEGLERLGLAYYRFSLTEPEAFRYMFIAPHESYSGRVADELVRDWVDSSRAALGLVAGLLEQAVADGDLRVAEPWHTAVAFWSALTGVIAIPSQGARQPFIGAVDTERMVVETVRSLLTGMSVEVDGQPRA